MYDLTNFTKANVSECGAKLRSLGAGAKDMEEVAGKIVDHLYKNLVEKKTGKKSCALVRFYKTHPYGKLDADLKKFAQKILGHPPDSPAMKCLTLLATAGDKKEWNSRKSSSGHKAIPLPSEQFVSQIPMIARLINQFGLELKTVLKPDPAIIVDLQQKEYNAFHVPEAVGSPYIPAQKDFVIANGIQSVLGFGGMLPSGNLFAVMLFAKVHIPREAADRCKALAIDVKKAVSGFDNGAVFSS